MIFGHSRPEHITWTVSGPGAAILSPANLLDDGRPDTLTRFRWISGTQNTSSVLRIRGDWATPLPIGMVYVSNVTLPAGTKMTIAARRASDGAGTYPYVPASYNPTQRVVAGVRGGKTAGILFQPGASQIVGIEVQLSNDVDGVASIPASQLFELGDIAPAQVTMVDIDADWSLDPTDPTRTVWLPDGGPASLPGVVWRTLSFKLPADDQSAWFNGFGVDYEMLLARLDRGQRAIYVPRHINSNGQFDAAAFHRTAAFGVMTKLPKMSHEAGPYLRGDGGTVREIPIPS